MPRARPSAPPPDPGSHPASDHPTPATRRSSASGVRADDGQAAVELVAVLPCVAALLLALWQAALAGHAAWAATAAARAAARAHAVGGDARRAARDHLPAAMERDLRVATASDGEVRVAVRVPTLPGIPSLGHARARAHFEPQ
jgi:hypothetical protein